MKKREEGSRELRDKPVPPVKGIINVPGDVIQRPEEGTEQRLLNGPVTPETWL